ncbi:uncharacterized protein LOC120670783 isoform X2 [Panicum virgatum]|uniref:uncharacterized protein LOC120670783 isoform X2 n=1 Tax=Panicum virgatum TaxID=38727 RepID=UPI0019D55EF6|nr:uncharacterized protein LOC120670783 isoform X2 [Panicum virgatum]
MASGDESSRGRVAGSTRSVLHGGGGPREPAPAVERRRGDLHRRTLLGGGRSSSRETIGKVAAYPEVNATTCISPPNISNNLDYMAEASYKLPGPIGNEFLLTTILKLLVKKKRPRKGARIGWCLPGDGVQLIFGLRQMFSIPQFQQVKLRRIIGAQFVALKINTRTIEAIWSSTGSFSTQSRKACPDAWQHSDHGSRWLATVQAL